MSGVPATDMQVAYLETGQHAVGSPLCGVMLPLVCWLQHGEVHAVVQRYHLAQQVAGEQLPRRHAHCLCLAHLLRACPR